MNLKDELLNFFNANNSAVQERNPIEMAGIVPGLCQICDNKPHCVWVENNKKYCEHYE